MPILIRLKFIDNLIFPSFSPFFGGNEGNIIHFFKKIPREEKDMGNWFRFFFGTPQRFLGTCAGLAILAAVIEPSLLHLAAERIMRTFEPLMGPFLQFAIIGYGFKLIFFGSSRGKKK